MIREAFKMKLYHGMAEEYQRRHDQIWPELAALIKKEGICNYSIYLDQETDILFAYMEIKEENRENIQVSREIRQKWWDYMKDIMETENDHRPKRSELTEMFHLD